MFLYPNLRSIWFQPITQKTGGRMSPFFAAMFFCDTELILICKKKVVPVPLGRPNYLQNDCCTKIFSLQDGISSGRSGSLAKISFVLSDYHLCKGPVHPDNLNHLKKKKKIVVKDHPLCKRYVHLIIYQIKTCYKHGPVKGLSFANTLTTMHKTAVIS